MDVLNGSESIKHEVKIIDRGLIYLSGVDKIISFDNNEFVMETNMGLLVLKGEGLEVVKLDTHDGMVTIKGLVNSYYYDEVKKGNGESFLGKLFR